ncbi:hypothetical protein PTKIN_Ptkin09bG0101500 [Pterospermum kingtungense]
MGLCQSQGFSQSHDIPISSSSSDSSPRPYQPLPKTNQEWFSPPPSKPSQIGTILLRPYVDITTIYDLEKELGRGTFGIIYLCIEKATGRKYACKSISRRKLTIDEQVQNVRREIAILQHLTGQPNIVEFKGAYEDNHNIHLVMEFCSGGELFARIIAKGSYSERQAASICRQIVFAVYTCHFMGVIHRNLKPENLVLLSKDENSPIKVIDFGLSLFIEEGRMYEDLVGTAYYIAPEILQRKYGKEIDMWSVGVILYILLSGVPPFWGEYPWMKEGGDAPDKPIDSAVLTRLKQFREMKKLKNLALKVIAESLSSEEEIKGLKQMFNNIVTDRSGTITLEELRDGLTRLGSKLTEAEIKQLMDAADVDRSGTVDYIEFVTNIMHQPRLEREDMIAKAFQFFDKDNSGLVPQYSCYDCKSA